MSFVLPELKYKYGDLEPVIDPLTVEIHYSRHHATYLKNLNAALENHAEFQGWSIEKILANISDIPEAIRTAVKNNGGGFYNHNLYWESLTPVSTKVPTGRLAEAINRTFNSFDEFKALLEKAGLSRFGSGWAWLSKNSKGELVVHSTANQDTPLAEGLVPLIAVDVWEHAYYLKYQNKRADYLSSIWSIIDWETAEKRFLV